MRRANSRIVGWCVVGALVCALLPAQAAQGETTTPAPAPTTEATASANDPHASAEDAAGSADDPAASPTPTPSAVPTEGPDSTPAPAPSPSPTETEAGHDDEDAEHAEHEHDGPTMPLTRELPNGSLPSLAGESTVATQSRLAASYGPQPVFRFPFAPGKRWGISGSHADSDGIHRGAIDFAPLSSSDKRVLAIASGRVYRVSCANGWFLGIDHGGGWMSEYYHLREAKSSLIGKWVEAGTSLGLAGQTLPCGGTPGSSAHVHLSILNTAVSVPSGKRQYIPVTGIQYDRFLYSDSSGYYNGVWRDFAGRTVLTSRGVTCCLTASSRVGPSSPKAVLPDANGNGIDDRTEILPWDTDLDSDGRPELIGFGSSGVLVSDNRGNRFAADVRALSSFTSGAWTVSKTPRMVMDANGDGRPDVVGFSSSGVYVALGNGSGGFGAPRKWVNGFGTSTGWSVTRHPRTLADVNGDSRPEIVGFSAAGVAVAVNNGSSFSAGKIWLRGFGSNASVGGWNTTQQVRYVMDVNGDRRADIVGFGDSGVHVALSTGNGFSTPTRWTTAFGTSRGWSAASTPRYLEDMNADGRPDIVGFGPQGVFVALNTGSGFATARKWTSSFGSGSSGGWRVNRDPRTLADITGDGRPDIVGFRVDGVYVARNTGSSFAKAVRWTTDFGSREWTLGLMPRAVVDVNNDGRADIVGFARHGVHVALNDGSRFRAAAHWSLDYGWGISSGDWHIRTKPRGISAG
ncbi:hypothetical protein MICABA_02440 [Microbacterium sp. T2.11-28]|nr:hypothetical protein MICABA_02440 [Microbacterium sp. T2.11-28]